MTLRNPVIPGFNPDPSICRVGEDYYLVTSSFEYFPGVPLYHSRDLVHWELVNHVLSRPSQLAFPRWRPSGGIFAATIRHHGGVFYVVTTNMSSPNPARANFFVHTRDPLGEWSEPVWLDQGGIDPSLFFDDDGRVYLTSNWFEGFPPPVETDPLHPTMGLQQCEIDPTTGARLTASRKIWAGTGARFPEAPHLYRRGEWYYLLMSEGGTELNHMASLARSATPWGPWEPCPHNPVLTHRSVHSPFQSVGHADLVEAHDGTWWLVCLGTRPQGDTPQAAHLGRETFLAPVRWDDDGWPHLGLDGLVKIQMEMDAPAFVQPAPPPPPVRDDFTGDRLAQPWVHLGTPLAGASSLTARPGWLRLHGNAARLQDGPPVAFVGRRQEHLTCTARARLAFGPTPGDEAGLTVWVNPKHHVDLFVTRRGGARHAVVRQQVGEVTAELASTALPEGEVILTVHASPERYDLGVEMADGTSCALCSASTRYLAPEIAGGCTGVMLALYATGNGQASTAPADFDWFDLIPGDRSA